MTAENEEDYNSDVPVSWQMTIIMYPYFPPGDSRRSSMGLALWALTKTQFIISIVYDTIDTNIFN
jgi:hypothetical protein